jgi:hypothetical protein
MPAACRICHTVDGAAVTLSFASSPWMRVSPQRVLLRQPNDEAGDARGHRRAAGPQVTAQVSQAIEYPGGTGTSADRRS